MNTHLGHFFFFLVHAHLRNPQQYFYTICEFHTFSLYFEEVKLFLIPTLSEGAEPKPSEFPVKNVCFIHVFRSPLHVALIHSCISLLTFPRRFLACGDIVIMVTSPAALWFWSPTLARRLFPPWFIYASLYQ